MIWIYINLFITAIIVAYINIYYAKIEEPTLTNIIKAGIYMAPLQILAGIGYSFYYAKGMTIFSYVTLNLSAYPLMIAMGIIAHFLFFRGHEFTFYEILGMIFTGLGMIFFLMASVNKWGL